MRSPFFAIFWGFLCCSGIEPFIQHAREHRWWMCFFGVLAMLWTGANAYLNAKPEAPKRGGAP